MILSYKSTLVKKPLFLAEFIKNKGSQSDSILFEQYKLFIHHNEEIRNRRQQINSFFLTVNSLITGVLGTFMDKHFSPEEYFALILFLLVLGMGCVIAWINALGAFNILTTKSYQFIKLMEQHLGAQVFTEFYDHLHSLDTKKEHSTFLISREKIIPWLFFGGYVLYILVNLYNFLQLF